MQKRLIIVALLAGVVTFMPVVSAQTPTPAQVIIDAEAERERQISKELSLNLPETSDDPNYPVTFVDPSKKGVELTIGTKITQNAPSPFILPNLPIGSHTVTFKFTNKDGLVRVLSKELIIIPKPPIFDQTIKTQVARPNQIVLSGTALPQSTVMIIVNSSTVNKFSSNQEGKWEFILPDPAEGKNSIIAFVLRDGLISEASKPISVEYKLFATDVTSQIPVQEAQNQVTQVIERVKAFMQTNPNEFYAIIGGALFIIIILIGLNVRKKLDKKNEEKSIADIFGNMANQKTILDIVSEGNTENKAEKTKEKDSKSKEKLESSKEKSVTTKEKTSKKEVILDAVAEAPKADKDKKETVIEEKLEVELPTFQKRKVDIESKRVSTQKKAKVGKKAKKINSEKREDAANKAASRVIVEKDVEETPESDEPAKKILSKEEFLKQFQTKNEKSGK
jgi:hypothetical protein